MWCCPQDPFSRTALQQHAAAIHKVGGWNDIGFPNFPRCRMFISEKTYVMYIGYRKEGASRYTRDVDTMLAQSWASIVSTSRVCRDCTLDHFRLCSVFALVLLAFILTDIDCSHHNLYHKSCVVLYWRRQFHFQLWWNS